MKGWYKMKDVKNATVKTDDVNTSPEANAELAGGGTPNAHDFMRAAYHARKNPDHVPSIPMSGDDIS